MRAESPVTRVIALAIVMSLLLCFGADKVEARSSASEGPMRVVLTDGVRLIMKPESTGDFIAFCVFVRLNRESDMQQEAIAELVARAVFYGSLHQSVDSVSASLAQVGGLLETFVSPQCVAYICVTVPEQVREAIYLLSEAVKNADFNADALAKARQDLIEEQRRREAVPLEVARDRFRQTFRQETVPDISAFSRVTQVQARAYFAAHYVPAQTVVSVAGRFRPTTVQTLFDANLVSYDRIGVTTAPAPQPVPTASIAVPRALATSGTVKYAFVGVDAPWIGDRDYPVFAVLQALLGIGHASRLFRRIRDETGVGYEVGADYQVDRAAPLIGYVQWDGRRLGLTPGKEAGQGVETGRVQPEKVLSLLQHQFETVLTDPPTEEEVTRARNIAVGREALRHERARDRAFLLGWYECVGLGFDFDRRLPQLLQQVSRDDILRVAKNAFGHKLSLLSGTLGY